MQFFLLITVHVHCTYYEAQEDTSERSGIDRGRNLGIQNIHARKLVLCKGQKKSK